MNRIPESRIKLINETPPRSAGYILYWMSSCRRLSSNYALDLAVARAADSGRGLVIAETLFCDEPWASNRFHHFVLEGMRDNAAEAKNKGVAYFAWVESSPDTLFRALEQLAKEAACVVTDEFPSEFHNRKIRQLAARIGVRLETVDSNGLLPLRAADQVFKRAFSFRRFLQGNLLDHFREFPSPKPLDEARNLRRDDLTVSTSPEIFQARQDHKVDLGCLPINHDVGRVSATKGGPSEATRFLERFIAERLDNYAQLRNQPDLEATSELSPYLHFGHISPHQILHALAATESWSPERVSGLRTGQREGWWGMSENAESFLDELVTWRELGFNMAWQCSEYDSYDSLPKWAVQTLDDHSSDPRPHLYDVREFEEAQTHDKLWNAAQRQLVLEGRIQNYLRMLWGKKILEWTRSPKEALEVMIELNNKYALDGRDPNSYSGIFWVLGRYDRAWGPERSIFGKIRYMTSRNTARKYPVKDYLQKFGG